MSPSNKWGRNSHYDNRLHTKRKICKRIVYRCIKLKEYLGLTRKSLSLSGKGGVVEQKTLTNKIGEGWSVVHSEMVAGTGFEPATSGL